MKWLIEHWDRFILPIFSALLAGAIGFFAATGQMKDEINQLEIAVANLNSQLKHSVDPHIDVVIDHTKRIYVLEKTVSLLKSDTERLEGQTEDLSEQQDNLILLQAQRGVQPSPP